MLHYITLNEENICTRESWLSGAVEVEGLILVDTDESLFGRKYHPDTNEWEELPPPSEPKLEKPSISPTEEMMANILLRQAEIQVRQEE